MSDPNLINYICKEHSGCIARIENIEKENVEQWNKMVRTDGRMDKIFMRINIILGGIAISCLLLAINAAIKLIAP